MGKKLEERRGNGSCRRRRLSQDGIPNPIRKLRVPGDAFWPHKRALDLPNDHEYVIIYLDDRLIYGRRREQHLKDLDAVFTLLHKNRLITKGFKCDFLKQELEFLGHIVSTKGVKIDPKKINTIQEWKSPSNIKVLQSFLGFDNYVHRFIPNMAWLSAPLTDQLKDHDCFWWKEKQQVAFDQLKIAITSTPVLRISDPDRLYEVITNASDIAIGAVLLHDFGDGLQPVAYESRKL
ncbi:hypothetical protein CLOM_g10542 [Closterium sp. NIES-68]|nr:hypothetical protein CLOM_g10542 [Closterium sp. NIES-68]GJP59076.1 hypothetical protein CLOP_g7154 [Closterium sp. NIES-67]